MPPPRNLGLLSRKSACHFTDAYTRMHGRSVCRAAPTLCSWHNLLYSTYIYVKHISDPYALRHVRLGTMLLPHVDTFCLDIICVRVCIFQCTSCAWLSQLVFSLHQIRHQSRWLRRWLRRMLVFMLNKTEFYHIHWEESYPLTGVFVCIFWTTSILKKYILCTGSWNTRTATMM